MVQVDVIVVSCPTTEERLEYLQMTLASLRRYLNPAGTRRWLCSGEADGVAPELLKRWTGICAHENFATVCHQGKRNLGSHMNWIYDQHVSQARLHFICQEDIALCEPLDLRPAVDLMTAGLGRYVRFFLHEHPTFAEDEDAHFNRITGGTEHLFGYAQYLSDLSLFRELGRFKVGGGSEFDMNKRFFAENVPVWVKKGASNQQPFFHIGEQSAMKHRCGFTPLDEARERIFGE